jgi:hypothetical protein
MLRVLRKYKETNVKGTCKSWVEEEAYWRFDEDHKIKLSHLPEEMAKLIISEVKLDASCYLGVLLREIYESHQRNCNCDFCETTREFSIP